MTEFSDHCPITFSLQFTLRNDIDDNCCNNVDNIIWNSDKAENFIDFLNTKKYMFADISDKFTSGEYDINKCLNCLTDVVYNISFQCFGKTCSSKPRNIKK